MPAPPIATAESQAVLEHLILVVDKGFSEAAKRHEEILTRLLEQGGGRNLSGKLGNGHRKSERKSTSAAAGSAWDTNGVADEAAIHEEQEEGANGDKDSVELTDRPSQHSHHRTSGPRKTDTTTGDLSDKSKLQLSRKHISQAEALKSSWTSWARPIVNHYLFEMAVAFVIVAQAIVMCYEVQYRGLQVGFDLNYPKYGKAADDTWPLAELLFLIGDWIFGILFLIEALLKFLTYGYRYFCSAWNWLDSLCVVAWLMDKVAASLIPLDAQTLRLMKLFRLMRLVKLLRNMEAMDVLFVMTAAIREMTMILVWAVILLSMMLVSCALFLSQILHSTYFNNAFSSNMAPQDLARYHEMYAYFGSTTRCLLSMFEITLGNWPPVARLISEELSEWFMLIFIIHKLTIGFAVIGVINGVILQETFKVASTDDMIMVRQRKKGADLFRRKMTALVQALDHSDDGMLDFQEFEIIANQPEVKLWLHAMDIETDELELLFSMIDNDDSGFVTVDELCLRIGRLKGAARSLDVMTLRHELSKMRLA